MRHGAAFIVIVAKDGESYPRFDRRVGVAPEGQLDLLSPDAPVELLFSSTCCVVGGHAFIVIAAKDSWLSLNLNARFLSNMEAV